MIKIKVSIHNYQIVEKADLEFPEGLTAIIGPSNNGKSSILKGIKAAIFNEAGTSPIRAGENKYIIGIQYNGHTILFQKGLKESFYLIDGQKLSTLGRGQVPQVAEALQIKELELNGNKEIINFWDQMAYPFLLDRSPMELFRFIVDSGEDSNLMTCLKDMTSDRKLLSTDILKQEAAIEQVESQISVLNEQTKNTDSVYSTCDRVIKLNAKVQKLKTLKLVYDRVSELNKMLFNINNEYLRIDKEAKAFTKASNRIQDLKSNFILYSDLYNSILKHNELHTKITEKYNIIDKIKNIINVSKLDCYKNYINLENLIVNKNNIIIALNSKKKLTLNISTKLERLNILKQALVNIEAKNKTLNNIKSNFELNSNQIDQFNKLKNEYFNVCPVCGKPLDIH